MTMRQFEAQAETSLCGHRALCDLSGALYFPELELLTFSDLHLEKGAAFARRGFLLPPYDTQATLKKLQAVLARFAPKIVISLGDNFHDRRGADHLPDVMRSQIAQLTQSYDWFWITGNHDPDGVQGLGGVVADEIHLSGLIFRHEPQKTMEAKGEIAGHLHPAATLLTQQKNVKRPAFVSDGERMILPSFGVTTGGLDLSNPAFHGLFLRHKLTIHMLGREHIYRVSADKIRL